MSFGCGILPPVPYRPVDGVMSSMDSVETDRLLLRRWRPDDLDHLVQISRKPEVWWFPFQRGLTAEETAAFLDRKLNEWESRGWSQWAVETKDDLALIGSLGLCPPDFLPEVMPTVEVGFRLDPDYWGQGLATEGGCAALEFGFNVLGLAEIVSIYEPDNIASGRVMQRLGMVYDRDTKHPALGVLLRVLKIHRDSGLRADDMISEPRWRSVLVPWRLPAVRYRCSVRPAAEIADHVDPACPVTPQ